MNRGDVVKFGNGVYFDDASTYNNDGIGFDKNNYSLPCPGGSCDLTVIGKLGTIHSYPCGNVGNRFFFVSTNSDRNGDPDVIVCCWEKDLVLQASSNRPTLNAAGAAFKSYYGNVRIPVGAKYTQPINMVTGLAYAGPNKCECGLDKTEGRSADPSRHSCWCPRYVKS